MDFNTFDNRTVAEEGKRFVFKDPRVIDGEPVMDGDKECAVFIRGTSAKSVQLAMRARAKTKMGGSGNRVMEDIHEDLVSAAVPLIVRCENVSLGGKPVGDDRGLIKQLMECTFPVMAAVEDEDGNAVIGDNGVPKFEMKNNPFAKQVAEFAAEVDKQLGNVEKG